MTTIPTGAETVLVLWKASRAVEARALESITHSGLSATDFGILEALLHKGPLPVSVLGRKMLLTSGSITTAVDRLVRRGLVARRDDAGDRRVRRVHLTAEGRRVITPAFVRHAADLEQVVGVLSREERRTLVALLRKLGLGAASASEHQETP
jgi:MarR family 2-MHQ and catechol resistance regulon transcriptional repressor